MKPKPITPLLRPIVRAAIYTRKSTEEGLDSPYNTLEAQRDAGDSYIRSQAGAGWVCLPDHYDDGGFSGGTMERPALRRLLEDIRAGRVDVVVVYKIDRLSRSLRDFFKLFELFEAHCTTFVSVTQAFNTSNAMGRLALNILLLFSEFEREVAGERIRDKINATKARGQYFGPPPLGFNIDPVSHAMTVNAEEAALVLHIYKRFNDLQSVTLLARELNADGYRMKKYVTKAGTVKGGQPWKKEPLYRLLHSQTVIGKVMLRGEPRPGAHEPIVPLDLWERVQSIIGTDIVARRSNSRATSPLMLSGVIRCGHCGRAMVAQYSKKRGRRYNYYLCTADLKAGAGTCPLGRLAAGEIETVVMAQLQRVWSTPELVLATMRGGETVVNMERARLEQDRQLLESEMQGLVTQRNEGHGDASRMRAWEDRINYLQGEVVRLAEEIEALDRSKLTHPEVLAALRNIEAVWSELSPAEQNRMISLLVESVTVTTDGIEIAIKTAGIRSLQPQPEVKRARVPASLRS